MPENFQNRQIFLSHSSPDKEFVRMLAHDLKRYGLKVWFDEWEIKVGDSLRKKISTGIVESAWLVVILSKNSVQSSWVQIELNAALAIELESKNVFVLPVMLDDCDIPLFLKDKLYADFRKDYQFGLQKLLEPINSSISLTQKSWWGRWTKQSNSKYFGGTLVIHKLTSQGFEYWLNVHSGAHLGSIDGFAEKKNTNYAMGTHKTDEVDTYKDPCLIHFMRTGKEDGLELIEIKEQNCTYFHGFSVEFNGIYKKENEYLLELDSINEQDLSQLYSIMGGYYWDFRDVFHIIGEYEISDTFSCVAYHGAPAGLFTITEAIIMKGIMVNYGLHILMKVKTVFSILLLKKNIIIIYQKQFLIGMKDFQVIDLL